MSKQVWLDYFRLLDQIAASLEELGELQKEKTVCVNKGNLPRIEEIMKKEQSFTLSLRGSEQKRLKTLAMLQVPPGPVGDLHLSMPPEVKDEGLVTVSRLQKGYAFYNEQAKVSRATLEAHLGQLAEVTGMPPVGYMKPPATTTARAAATARQAETKQPVEGSRGAPGNMELDLRKVREVAESQHKIISPISQEVLKRVKKEQDALSSQDDIPGKAPLPETSAAAKSELDHGNVTSELRQFAQREERSRNSAIQKENLKKNAQNNP